MLYPSSRSPFRSGLRFIGRCDIKDHFILDPYGLTFNKRAFLVLSGSASVRDGVKRIRTKWRLSEGEPGNLIEGECVLRYLLFPCVNNDLVFPLTVKVFVRLQMHCVTVPWNRLVLHVSADLPEELLVLRYAAKIV